MKNIITRITILIVFIIMSTAQLSLVATLSYERKEVNLQNDVSNIKQFFLENSLSNKIEIENYYPNSKPEPKSFIHDRKGKIIYTGDVLSENKISRYVRDILSESKLSRIQIQIVLLIVTIVCFIIINILLENIFQQYQYRVIEIFPVDNSNNQQRKKSNFEIEFEYYNMIVDYKISGKLKNELFSNKDNRYSINTIRKVYFFPELAVDYDKTLYYIEEIESFDDIKEDNSVGEYIIK